MSTPLTLVLASASPRRRELAGLLGVPLACDSAEIDERRRDGEPPAIHVLRVAREKAEAVAVRHAGAPVLAADTIVVLGDSVLGKPRDRAESLAMLARLSGRAHVVLTGMCALFRGRCATAVEAATVVFRELSPALREWYAATGEGDDKAGAYALQGAGGALVVRVEGNPQAVVGLPLGPVTDLLERVGVAVARDGATLTLAAAAPAARRRAG
jgi:septum formation protein